MVVVRDMQWKLHEDAMIDDADVVDEPESDDYAMEKRDGSDLERDEFIEAALDQVGGVGGQVVW